MFLSEICSRKCSMGYFLLNTPISPIIKFISCTLPSLFLKRGGGYIAVVCHNDNGMNFSLCPGFVIALENLLIRTGGPYFPANKAMFQSQELLKKGVVNPPDFYT